MVEGTDRSSAGLALLRLLQIFDSQFPVGAFAQSGGVETYASLGGGLREVREILHAQIALGWGRSELAAAHLAWRAAGLPEGDSPLFGAEANDKRGDCPLLRVAREVDALKVVPAVRNASIGLGRRTMELLRRVYGQAAVDIEPPHHAVVIGAAGRRLGIDARPLLLGYAHSLAMGTLSAALRCMPVSPAQAQLLLGDVHGDLCGAVDRALADPEGSLFTCTPALDVRSHEQAYLRTRLFQS
jgi:urease accessory protein